MNFLTILNKMIVLFAFIGVGLLCQKLHFIDQHTSGKLNKLVLHIFAPCLILHAVFESELSYAASDLILLIFYGIIYNTITLLVSFLIAKLTRRGKPDERTHWFLMAYSNCVFMGYPVVAAIFGNSAVFLASICCVPYNIFLYTFGALILGGKGKSFREFLRILLNPAFFATMISLIIFFTRISVPQPVVDIFGSLGNMVTPLAMMLIGVSLGSMSLKVIFADFRVYIVSIARLLIHPVVIYFVFRCFVHDALFLNLFVIFASMPCASISPVFCTEYGGDSPLASKSVFITTLCSLITVPVLLSVLLQ